MKWVDEKGNMLRTVGKQSRERRDAYENKKGQIEPVEAILSVRQRLVETLDLS